MIFLCNDPCIFDLTIKLKDMLLFYRKFLKARCF